MDAKSTCEWEDCTRVAEGYVEAQWSMFDFMRFETCEEHLESFYEWMSLIRFEGMGPPELWSDLYRDWSDGYALP